MGFFESLGSLLGEVAGNGMAKVSKIQEYKNSYEYLPDDEIKRELSSLQGKSSEEARHRVLALNMILKDRNLL